MLREDLMRKDLNSILLRIEHAIEQKEYDAALSLFEENAAELISAHSIKPMMLLTGNIPFERFTTPFQKLILGWACLLCGDNGHVRQILDEVESCTLTTAVESAIYYSLKAVSIFSANPEEALKYARFAVDTMEKDANSLYAANVRLTYGQLLSGIGDHRMAAHEFFNAYHIFKKHRYYYPAVVSLVSYGLKKYALGEIAETVTLFRNELAACSRKDKSGVYQLIRMPLGVAFFEMNKQKLAIRHLESVMDLMYQLGFVQMYGVLEMYLVYAYGVSGWYERAYALIDELAGRLSRLNFENVGTLCAALRAHINLLEGTPVSDSDKELLEAEYLVNGKNTPIGTLLMLARLKLNGDIDRFNMNDLISWYDSPDAARNIPFAQTAAILIAEYYYQMREISYCREYLEKAVTIYTNCRLSVRFLIEKAECLTLLRDINRDLYRMLKARMKRQAASGALTPREKEILSLMAQGLSNKEIAHHLYIGVSTAKWHINNIYGKLHAKRRSQAIAQARKLGLLP